MKSNDLRLQKRKNRTNLEAIEDASIEVQQRIKSLEKNLIGLRHEMQTTALGTPSLSLDLALKKLSNTKRFKLLKINIMGSDFFGVSSIGEDDWAKKLIEAAQSGHKSRVAVQLRKYAYLHEVFIVGDFENEIVALVNLLSQIETVEQNTLLNTPEIAVGENFKLFVFHEENCEEKIIVEDLIALEINEDIIKVESMIEQLRVAESQVLSGRIKNEAKRKSLESLTTIKKIQTKWNSILTKEGLKRVVTNTEQIKEIQFVGLIELLLPFENVERRPILRAGSPYASRRRGILNKVLDNSQSTLSQDNRLIENRDQQLAETASQIFATRSDLLNEFLAGKPDQNLDEFCKVLNAAIKSIEKAYQEQFGLIDDLNNKIRSFDLEKSPVKTFWLGHEQTQNNRRRKIERLIKKRIDLSNSMKNERLDALELLSTHTVELSNPLPNASGKLQLNHTKFMDFVRKTNFDHAAFYKPTTFMSF